MLLIGVDVSEVEAGESVDVEPVDVSKFVGGDLDGCIGVEEDEADEDDDEDDALEGDEFSSVFAGKDGFVSEDEGADAGVSDDTVVDEGVLEGSEVEGDVLDKGAGVDASAPVDGEGEGVIFDRYFANDPHIGRGLPGLSQ